MKVIRFRLLNDKEFVSLGKIMNCQVIKYRVPGRINLIGEHTDYNEGLVFPAAIHLGLTFSISLAPADQHAFYSGMYNDKALVSLDGTDYDKPWARYFSQVIQLFHTKFDLSSSIKCHFEGDLPIGAGLSSSSALACGLIYGLNVLLDLDLSKMEMVRLASIAENGTGLQGGMMDQFSIIHGEKNCLLLIDCRDMSHEIVPFAIEGYELVLIDSGVEHSLVETGYNDRRSDCEQGLAILKQQYPELQSVRDITKDQLGTDGHLLSDVQERRLRFVLDENERVLSMREAVIASDAPSIGKLLYASHQGLRDLYEVSCEELDFIVDWTKGHDEIVGSRIMGGGFGGCSIQLVKKGVISELILELSRKYERRFAKKLKHFPIQLGDGIHNVTISNASDQ